MRTLGIVIERQPESQWINDLWITPDAHTTAEDYGDQAEDSGNRRSRQPIDSTI